MITTTIELDRNNLVTLRRKIDDILQDFKRKGDLRKWATIELGNIRIVVRNKGKKYNRKPKEIDSGKGKIPTVKEAETTYKAAMLYGGPNEKEAAHKDLMDALKAVRSCKKEDCHGCNSVPCEVTRPIVDDRIVLSVVHNFKTRMTEVWFSRKPTVEEGKKIFQVLKDDGFGWNGKAWIRKYTLDAHRDAVTLYDATNV